MNNFQFIGVVCKGNEDRPALDIRTSDKGTTICVFTLAVYDSYQKSNDFHRITAFGKQAEIIEKYVNPGDQVGVQGRVKDYKYKSKKDGNDRYEKSFIMEKLTLPKREDARPAQERYQAPSQQGVVTPPQQSGDDSPF